jgi:hypothetical protein
MKKAKNTKKKIGGSEDYSVYGKCKTGGQDGWRTVYQYPNGTMVGGCVAPNGLVTPETTKENIKKEPKKPKKPKK